MLFSIRKKEVNQEVKSIFMDADYPDSRKDGDDGLHIMKFHYPILDFKNGGMISKEQMNAPLVCQNINSK